MIQNWEGVPGYRLLTDDDIRRIIIAFVEGLDSEEVHESLIQDFVLWMQESKLRGIIYDLIMNGWVAVTKFDKEVGPTVSASEEAVGRVLRGWNEYDNGD